MIVLWIILAILAIPLLVILFGTVKVRIAYREKVKLKVGLWFLSFTVLSDKQKKEKEPKELEKCKNPDKVLRRELKRQEKAAAAARKKAAKKAEKKKKKAKSRAEAKAQKRKEEAEGKKTPSPNLKENLEMILTLLKKLYAATRGKFKLRLKKMHIAIGTEDAAQTAILYGVAVQSASYILNFLNEKLIPIKRREGAVNIYPDYTALKTSVDVDIVCSFKIRSVIAIGVKMLLAFLSARSKALKKAILREQKKNRK